MKKIAIYSELKNNVIEDTAFELISKAKELAEKSKNTLNYDVEITTVLVANEVSENDVKKAFMAGSDNFVLLKNCDFGNFSQSTYSGALVSYLFENPHDFILFPATPTGRMIAPRVTTILDTGLVADCTGLDFIVKDNDIKLASTRPTFGAELMATILSKKRPECATIRPKTFKPNFSYSSEGKFKEFSCSIIEKYNFKIVDSKSDKKPAVDFSNFKIIFGAGYGLYDGQNYDYINKLHELARILGAGFAVSRKLVDFKISKSEFQVGQTGATVTPDLYVAFGISGAIQHIQGIKNSKTIVAINSDPNADIFNYADYKIVANAKNIIDQMYLKLGY